MPERLTAPEDGPAREVYASRAVEAYAAMQKRFRTRSGLYRRDGLLHRPGTSAHLWPFARAMFAALDLAGTPGGLGGLAGLGGLGGLGTPGGLGDAGFDAEAAIAADLDALERYWDMRGPVPAYSSDVVSGRLGRGVGPMAGGDRYYDDNAWVGLALVQLERLRPGMGRLDRAAEVFGFAVSGWDTNPDAPSAGGVFWVEQVRGLGLRNHDRNTVSTAPNAQLGLHLAELGAGDPAGGEWSVSPEEMVAWVNRALDASRDTPAPGTGLFFDKLRGDGTLDDTLWSYNQGSMIGANVLLARGAESEQRARFLARAEAIARGALTHYAGVGYERQGPAFNAIFFRNLLLLHAASGDEALRAAIIAAMRAYADDAWAGRRNRRNLFRFSRSGVTLLDQSSITQILALLAWDPEAYWKLA
ncbi:MAG TPA: glycoside hydrolase family 76 protein [Solirubrobacteraceae bacterium]|nr:glycoside hydrolase family 76 protein [Solirubrobacteraceae bacterium]